MGVGTDRGGKKGRWMGGEVVCPVPACQGGILHQTRAEAKGGAGHLRVTKPLGKRKRVVPYSSQK